MKTQKVRITAVVEMDVDVQMPKNPVMRKRDTDPLYWAFFPSHVTNFSNIVIKDIEETKGI